MEGDADWEGEAPAEPERDRDARLGSSLALPDQGGARLVRVVGESAGKIK